MRMPIFWTPSRIDTFDRWRWRPGFLPRVVSTLASESLAVAWMHRHDPWWQCIRCHHALVHPFVCDRCGWRIDEGRLDDERYPDDVMNDRPCVYRVWRALGAMIWGVRGWLYTIRQAIALARHRWHHRPCDCEWF